MKIEKISDNQIRFILDQNDLKERDMQITELIHSSDKTRALVAEMMEQALIEYDFHVENTPLMIEAVPVQGDSIAIIITKISDMDKLENKLGRIASLFDLMSDRDKIANECDNTCAYSDVNDIIFAFDTLDNVSEACARLFGFYTGDSTLYKKGNKYYLALYNYGEYDASIENFADILAEYSNQVTATPLGIYYLVEHAEVIVKKSAVQIMAVI